MREPGEELDELASEVIGAAIEVHRKVGPGFLEAVYLEALGIELELREIPFEREVTTTLTYKGRTIGKGRIDILVDKRLVVELKAIKDLKPLHKAQLLSYLKAMDLRLGLLMNFNNRLLKNGVRRVIWGRATRESLTS